MIQVMLCDGSLSLSCPHGIDWLGTLLNTLGYELLNMGLACVREYINKKEAVGEDKVNKGLYFGIMFSFIIVGLILIVLNSFLKQSQ